MRPAPPICDPNAATVVSAPHAKAGHPMSVPVIGYHAAHEQFPPAELVDLAVAAEEAGFDALWVSDHFHPWQPNQGHAGHAWMTLAAMGQRTRRLHLGTSVTCPT